MNLSIFGDEEQVDLCCCLLLMLLLLETVDGPGKLCVSVALAFSFSALTFRRWKKNKKKRPKQQTKAQNIATKEKSHQLSV